MKLQANKMPEIVRIELSSSCNLRCPQCRHNRPGKDKKNAIDAEMSREQVNQIIDEIAPYNPSVTLNVGNEPLIAKNFKECAKRVKEKGLAATFNTNGIAMTEEIAHFLMDIQFDSITFSIDAFTPQTLKKVRGIDSLDKSIEKVDMMLKIRGDNPFPRIGVSFCEQPANEHELQDFLHYWGKKVDVIRVSGFIYDDNLKLPEAELPSRIPCKQIFRDMVIRANGDVSPCVVSVVNPEITMGNIFKDGGVAAVWNSEPLNTWRSLHNIGKWNELSPCNKCDYWVDSCNVQEKIQDGFLIRYSSSFSAFYNVIDRMKTWNKNLHDRIGHATTDI
jgi:radical SAM protein with 4Fe4S-binding SPASM domain